MMLAYYRRKKNVLFDWCGRNGLALNTDKCKYIRFSRKCHPNSHIYKINNKTLKEVDYIKDLGDGFDSKIKFHTHIDKISSKAFQMLGFLIRNSKDFKKPQTKNGLYSSLVRSGLEYCAQVWSPHYEVHIKVSKAFKSVSYGTLHINAIT
nr:uncharacterized protein LOC113403094 [Vanessa tameamea]